MTYVFYKSWFVKHILHLFDYNHLYSLVLHWLRKYHQTYYMVTSNIKFEININTNK